MKRTAGWGGRYLGTPCMITLGNCVSITLFAELCHPWSQWLLIGPTPPKEFSQQCGNRFQTLWHTCYPSQPQSSIVIWVTSYRQQQQHEKHRPHHTSTPTCPQFSRVHWMGSTSQQDCVYVHWIHDQWLSSFHPHAFIFSGSLNQTPLQPYSFCRFCVCHYW